MKYVVLLVAALLLCSVAVADEMRIVKSANGKTLELQALAKELAKYDIIFFGEFHDNATIHKIQRDILPLLDGKRELILSFEMFERDVQSDLDAYVEGWTSEEQFLAASRPWGNYATDYKPLVEYAKEHKLSAIAANVPRRLAGMLTRQGLGFREQLEDSELQWLPAKHTYPDDDYKKAFYATMSGMGAHGMDSGMELIYMAQCLKDDAMAESIVRAISNKPKARILHFNGDFHSRSFLGTVSRVKDALPKLKLAVIAPVYNQNWQTATLTEEDKQAGNYVILLPEPPRGGEE